MNNIPVQSGANLEKNTSLDLFGEPFEPWGKFGSLGASSENTQDNI